MFASFPDLLRDLGVFNQWAGASGQVADRMNTICRKIMNTMFLVEQAEEYARSSAGGDVSLEHKMRAMDAYIDSAVGQIQGALDVLAAALTTKCYGPRKRPFSCLQMFDRDLGTLKSDFTMGDGLADSQTRILKQVYSKSHAMIVEHNDSKHDRMPERMIVQAGYPDYLNKINMLLVPKFQTAKNARDELSQLREILSVVGRDICALVGEINW